MSDSPPPPTASASSSSHGLGRGISFAELPKGTAPPSLVRAQSSSRAIRRSGRSKEKVSRSSATTPPPPVDEPVTIERRRSTSTPIAPRVRKTTSQEREEQPGSASNLCSPRDDSSVASVVSPRSPRSPRGEIFAYSRPFVKIRVADETKVIAASAADTVHAVAIRLLRKLCRHTHGVVTAKSIGETREQYCNYYLHFETLHGKWNLCDEGERAFRYLDVKEELRFMEQGRRLAMHRMPPEQLVDDAYLDLATASSVLPRDIGGERGDSKAAAGPENRALLRMQFSRGDSLLRMDGGRMFVVGDHLEETGKALDYEVEQEAEARPPTVYSYSEVSGDMSDEDTDQASNPFHTPRVVMRGIYVEVDEGEQGDGAGGDDDAVAAEPELPPPSPLSAAFRELVADACVPAPRMPGFFFCEDGSVVFEKHKVIGKGGYGVVYKATFRPTGEEVALKEMPLLSEMDPHSKKLVTEIKVLAMCDHPNIVGFKGCFYNNDSVWVGMTLCSSGSLGEMLRSTPVMLNEDQVQVITRQIVRGLAYLHERGVIHRDVKLDNVLIGDDAVCLADLGVAGICSETEERAHSVAGTTYWLSPEMAMGGDYDYAADVWSLGITVIELFEKYPPYWDLLPVRQLYMLTSEDVDVPALKDTEQVSQDAEHFLAQCLQRDPSLRPSAAGLLAHPWLRHGVPAQYESHFVQFVAAQVSDLLEDQEVEEEELEDAGYGASGNVIDLSSSDDEDYYSSEEEVLSPRTKAPLVRRAIFLAQEKPIETLSELVDEMRFGSNPLSVKTRKYRLRSYKNTFVGREAVDWIMVRMNFDKRSEAVALGQLLMKRAMIRPSTDISEFVDGPGLYTFAADQKEKKTRSTMLRMKTISTKLRGSGERENEGRVKKAKGERTSASNLLSPRSRSRAKRQKHREAEREAERVRLLSADEMSALCRRMQLADGARSCETKIRKSKSQAVFSGGDLMAWLMRHVNGCTEASAERILQEMVDAKMLRASGGGKPFRSTASDMFTFRAAPL